MGKISLVLVDLQNDFLDPRFSATGHLAKAISLVGVFPLLAHARRKKWDVIHVCTNHESQETLPIRLKLDGSGAYCISGTTGADIIPAITVEKGEYIISKQEYGCFHGTNLDEIVSDSKIIVVGGVSADCCVHQTAFEAAARGKEVYIPYQATAASILEDYLSHMRSVAKSAAIVIDLSLLIESRTPSIKMQLPSSSIDEILRTWFKSRLECAQAYEDEILVQKKLPFETILKTLIQKLEALK